jgi:hypothetical protein
MTTVLRAIAVIAFLAPGLSICYIPGSRRWTEIQVAMTRINADNKMSAEENRRGPFEDTVWSWAWSPPSEPKKKGTEMEPDSATGTFAYADFTDLKIAAAIGCIAVDAGMLVAIGVACLVVPGFRFRHCPKCGAALR